MVKAFSITPLYLSLISLLYSCNNTTTQENWINQHISTSQILLTNKFKLEKAEGGGASSFLIQAPNGILLCTAKHLLDAPMGIIPTLKTDSFNAQYIYWKAYPRKTVLSSDTILVEKLLTEKAQDKDLLLFTIKPFKNNTIKVLKPRIEAISKNENLTIIGCEYTDTLCFQKAYPVIVDSLFQNKFIVKSNLLFKPSGFSGAPVIDNKGLVVGIVSAAKTKNGIVYLLIETIPSI